MFEYYEVHFKFTPAPQQLHYVDMLFNMVGHKIEAIMSPGNIWGKTRRGTVLPQVGGRLSHTLG